MVEAKQGQGPKTHHVPIGVLAVGVSSLAAVVIVLSGVIPAGAVSSRKASGGNGSSSTIVSGYEGYCALLKSGSVKCWGDNSYDQLGDGTNALPTKVPVSVKGVSGATEIVSGYEGYCALLKSGSVKCWGDNSYDQLGDGTNALPTKVPVSVKGVSDATEIVSGYEGYCALLKSGSVKCWGDNSYDQLGDGTNALPTKVPVSVKGLTGVSP